MNAGIRMERKAPGTPHWDRAWSTAQGSTSHIPALGHREKQRVGKWKWLMDPLLSQGCARTHSWCPELSLKQEQQEEQGQGMAVVPGKGGQPWFWPQEHCRRWDGAAGTGLWHLLPVELWPGAAPASPPPLYLLICGIQRKGEPGMSCLLPACTRTWRKGRREEGAELFWAASSSIPKGGILPLVCWLLCRKDLKTTYTKMIIKT